MKENTVIIGVGGAGCHILSKLNVDIPKLFIDTDEDNLAQYSGLLIGKKTLQGFSSFGEVVAAMVAVQESKMQILDEIKQFSSWIIVAPMGGGTSCGATQKLVDIAVENNKKVQVITNLPANWEGTKRTNNAINTLTYIQNFCDIKTLDADLSSFSRMTIKDFYRVYDEIYLSELIRIIYK